LLQDDMMLDLVSRSLSALLLVVGMLTSDLANRPDRSGVAEQARACGDGHRPPARSAVPDALPFARSALYFGTARPDGVVREEAVREFIAEHVTPLFPNGLTIVKAEGRFGATETIVTEPSFVLVLLLYPCQARADESRRIDGIRALYKDRFAQHSVLRVDDPQIFWVSH
jgi:hypothetical protein